MCQQSLDVVKKYWPDLTRVGRSTLLHCATSYPFGSAAEVAQQVKDLAEWTGCNLSKAMDFADAETDFVVSNNWRWIWPRQYDGMSDFEFFKIDSDAYRDRANQLDSP